MATGPIPTGPRDGRLALPMLLAGAALLLGGCDRPNPTESMSTPSAEAALSESGASKAVLVGFHAAPSADEIALVEGLGGEVSHQYRYIPVLAAMIPADQEEVLAADPSVAYISDDVLMEPYGGKQVTDWGVHKIEAPAAWAMGYSGQGVKVGIFDSGIDIDHPDLTVVGGIDLVGDGNGLDDCQGHGTHVAGIVGANNNGNHTVGVAPKAELYSMRFADCAWAGATESKMLIGIEWAIDSEMDVVNMSFGYTVPVPSPAAEAAFAVARERGVLLIAASGNSSAPVVGYPAAYESVIAVGATDDADQLAVFSQSGTAQDLTAPGVNNLASYLVGEGQHTALSVDTDGDRELEAIALLYAGMTRKQGISAGAVYVGFATPLDFQAVDCNGKVAVSMRGGGSFAEKTEAAMNAGCAAIVIHNHTPGNFNGTLGAETASDGQPWIPAVSVSLEEGTYLKEQIEAQPTTVTLINSDGNLAMLSGTSMASPHAAGVAALVLSKNSTLSPDEVRSILRASAEDLGVAGWDPQFGHGRVNARRAVSF